VIRTDTRQTCEIGENIMYLRRFYEKRL